MNYSEFEKEVANELKKYPFLKWQNKKTSRLVKKLFKVGYDIKNTVGMVILNN